MNNCSYSRLSAYDGCPRAYKFRYIDEAPEAPSEALMEGRIVHRAIADYNRHLVGNRLESDVTAAGTITRLAWQAEPHTLPSAKLGEIEALVAAFAQSHTLDLERVVGVEEWFRGLFVAEAQFRGIRDLVEIRGATARVTDYKTDHMIRSQAEVERDLQLETYAWATLREYPHLEKVVGVLDFVRHNVRREVTIDRERAAGTEERLAAMIRRVRQDKKFEPTPGSWCSWCGYIERCPAAAAIKAAGRVVVATPDDAARVAAELILLDRQISERKKALQGYCNIHGDVVVNGVAWGFAVTESRSIEDLPAFRRILAKHGLDPDEFLRVDGTAARKLWSNGDIAPDLEALAVDRSYTRFGSRRVKEGEAE